MRWCRFQNKEAASYGVIEGDDVIAIGGSPFEQYQRTGERYPLSSVKLLVPVIPPTFYAAGLNYREHVIESAAKRGGSTPRNRGHAAAVRGGCLGGRPRRFGGTQRGKGTWKRSRSPMVQG